jgi:hypothetical protein
MTFVLLMIKEVTRCVNAGHKNGKATFRANKHSVGVKLPTFKCRKVYASLTVHETTLFHETRRRLSDIL